MIAVDLFAGWGGFTAGAELAGVRVAWAANHWRLAVDVHAANHPRTAHACQDLRQADWTTLPRYDLLLASPACQGHSRASQPRRRHYHDAMRATAWTRGHRRHPRTLLGGNRGQSPLRPPLPRRTWIPMRSIALALALLLPACGGAVASAPDAPAELAHDASAPQDARQVVRLPRPDADHDATALSGPCYRVPNLAPSGIECMGTPCECTAAGVACGGVLVPLPDADVCALCGFRCGG